MIGERRAVLVLVLFLVFLLTQAPMAYSAEPSTSESVLFSDVVKLDTTKYNITKYVEQSKTGYFDDFGDLFKEEGDYVLEGNGSRIEVMYIRVNNTFSYFSLYLNEGTPIFTEQPSSNLIERTDAFLEDYQSYLGNVEFQQYREILSTVSEVDETSITDGNIRLEVKHSYSNAEEYTGTRFRWVNTFNGADYTSFSIKWRYNGEFAFSNDRYNKIGSTALNISREEAIGIATERVQNISWTVDCVEVGNVTILDDRTSVALLTAPKEPIVLYPYWQVSLTFDKVYSGNVYGVTYSIWADTGEVFYGFLNTFGGSVPEFPSGTPLLIALVVVVAVAVIYRQKLSKSTKRGGNH
jgi:hypothetical protein